MRRVIKRAAAKRDLILHFAFIAESSLDAARRFLVAAEKTFEDLAEMPYMGAPRDVLPSEFRDGIAVGRVIHAKQDYQRFLK